MMRQGLESFDTMSSYAQNFETELKKSFLAQQQRDNILVNLKVIHAADRPFSHDHQISKVKEEGEDGYEE